MQREDSCRWEPPAVVNVGEPSLRARYGLRGVRVGEASYPGPVASRV